MSSVARVKHRKTKTKWRLSCRNNRGVPSHRSRYALIALSDERNEESVGLFTNLTVFFMSAIENSTRIKSVPSIFTVTVFVVYGNKSHLYSPYITIDIDGRRSHLSIFVKTVSKIQKSSTAKIYAISYWNQYDYISIRNFETNWEYIYRNYMKYLSKQFVNYFILW